MRSKVAWGAALALGLVLLAGATFGLNQARLARRQARGFEIERHFPPNFTVVGLTNRAYRYEADRAHVQALLDEAVEVGADALRVHLLRASFRLDHGDPVGAARDMSVVARQVGTAYSNALAERYAALAPEARGALAVDLKELPERTTALDRYLDGYHSLREGNESAALKLLSDPEVRELAHAEELRLAFTPFPKALEYEGKYARAFKAYDDTIRLEAKIGGRTATTAHIAGRMLDVMNRYEEALEALREGIAFADRAHTIRINAGFAAFALGLFDEARRHLEVAIDLRPNYWRPLQELVWLLIERGEFDEALRRIEGAPLDEGSHTASWRLGQRASVEIHRALAEDQRGEQAASKLSVQRAVDHMLAVKQAGATPPRADATILDGLVAGEEQSIFIGLASLLREDPHHSWQLRSLLQHMPTDLDADASAAMRQLLESIAQRLTSRDP